MRKMGIGLGVGINRSNYAQGIFNDYSARVVADGGVVEGGACVDAVSSLLQSASLLLIPSGYKGGKLYAEIPTNGNGDLTWSRNSVANRTQSDGSIGSVAANVPRLSYMYGSCPALLLEPQRTNLALYSEQFDDASWLKINTSATSNTTTAPDGTLSADTILANGVSALHVAQTNNISFTTSTNYSFSVFAKKGTNNFIQLIASNSIGGMFANFDLDSGIVGTLGTTTGTTPTSSITNFGNGWYRCVMNFTANATTGQVASIAIVTSASAARAESNTLATSVILWGAQLEVGAYSTTYIPTTNASATRLADTFSRNNIYTNGLISASGGTWFVELRNNVAYTRDNTIRTGITDDTTNFTNALFLLSSPSSRLSVNKLVGGAFTSLYNTTSDITKLAIKWNGTTADIFANGTKVISATSFTPTNMQFLHSQGVGSPIFIQQMALFPTPLSDTDCAAITSI